MKRKPHSFEEFLECVIGVSMDHYKHNYDVETRMEVREEYRYYCKHQADYDGYFWRAE